MKTTLLTTILFIIALASFAQKVQVRSYVERTHISPKLGTSVGICTQDNIEIGGFYQHAMDELFSEEQNSKRMERQFYGVYFGYPMMSYRRMDVKFNLRTGVSNGENFVITPSVLGAFRPVPAINLGAGVGVRAFRPTLMGSISINLNNGSRGGFLAAR